MSVDTNSVKAYPVGVVYMLVVFLEVYMCGLTCMLQSVKC